MALVMFFRRGECDGWNQSGSSDDIILSIEMIRECCYVIDGPRSEIQHYPIASEAVRWMTLPTCRLHYRVVMRGTPSAIHHRAVMNASCVSVPSIRWQTNHLGIYNPTHALPAAVREDFCKRVAHLPNTLTDHKQERKIELLRQNDRSIAQDVTTENNESPLPPPACGPPPRTAAAHHAPEVLRRQGDPERHLHLPRRRPTRPGRVLGAHPHAPERGQKPVRTSSPPTQPRKHRPRPTTLQESIRAYRPSN